MSSISVLGKSRQADIYEFKGILVCISGLHAIKGYIVTLCLKNQLSKQTSKQNEKQI